MCLPSACLHTLSSQPMLAIPVRIKGVRRREGTSLVTCPAGLPVSWLRGLGIQGWSEVHCHLVHVRPLYAYNTHERTSLPASSAPARSERRDSTGLVHPGIPGSNLVSGTRQGITICQKGELILNPTCTVPEARLGGWPLIISGICRNKEN